MSGNTIAIITGTSKGIGKAMLEALLLKKTPCISINRRVFENHDPLFLGNLEYDLSNINSIEHLTDQIIKMLVGKIRKLILINNAAVIGSTASMSEVSIADLNHTINLNLLSPAILSSSLIRKIGDLEIDFDIVHISSGAAFQPLPGLGPYCISKAGLEMASSMINVEFENVRSITIGPGVVDTDMQVQLRTSNAEKFQSHEKFVSFKEKGFLKSPTEIGTKIIDFVLHGEFEGGQFYQLG